MTTTNIIDNKIYKKWHSIYIKNSNEHNIVSTLLKKIIFRLKKHKSFLDIGAANGALTKRISNSFQSVTVIEPNYEHNDVYKKHNYTYFNEYFMDLKIQDKFDFILCSHVFWLINKKTQKEFIRKAYNMLNEGGCASFITPASYGKGFEFYSRFFLDMSCDFNRLNQIFLNDLNYSIEVIPYTSHIKSKNFEDFFSICKLFTLESWLHPVNLTNDEVQKKIGNKNEYTNKQLNKIEEYIKNELYDENLKEYQMEECEVIINIWKS